MAVDEDMESLSEYTERLEKALAKEQPHTTYNRDRFHAFAIVLAVFQHAKREVRLLSNKLDLLLYGNPLLLQTIRDFLRKGGKLRILVESEIDREHPLAELVRSTPDDKASIRRIPAELLSKYKYNFMVMDDNGFRYESDRSKHAALAGFHDEHSKKVARNLRTTFDRFSKSALELFPQ